jgi:hypothetical protein
LTPGLPRSLDLAHGVVKRKCAEEKSRTDPKATAMQ